MKQSHQFSLNPQIAEILTHNYKETSEEFEQEIAVNTLELKQQILKTEYFHKYLLQYEDYLLNCQFDFNKPQDQGRLSTIRLSIVQDQNTIPYKRVPLTDKKYFTIGNVGTKAFPTTIDYLQSVRLEINEVEFQNLEIEFIHLEVNYQDLFKKSFYNQQQSIIDQILPYEACQSTKDMICKFSNFKEQTFKAFGLLEEQSSNISQQKRNLVWKYLQQFNGKIKVKSPRKTLYRPLIYIGQNSIYSILNIKGCYQIGTAVNITVKQIQNCFRYLIQGQQELQEFNLLYNSLRNFGKTKILGIPQMIVNIFDQIQISHYGIDQFYQDYKSYSQEVLQQLRDILNSPILHLRVTKQLQAEDCNYFLIPYNKKQFKFGSSNENDLVIHHRHVSRSHGYIQYQSELNKWKIIDGCLILNSQEESRHGTWRVMENDKYYVIDNGAKIKLGKVKLQLDVQLSMQFLKQQVQDEEQACSIIYDILQI